MKRIWLWAVIAAGLALSGLAPIKTQDAAELLPARVLLIWTEDGWVHTRCDAGAEGTGTDLEAALADMERTAQGALFLDTAEHIVLHGGASIRSSGRRNPTASTSAMTTISSRSRPRRIPPFSAKRSTP